MKKIMVLILSLLFVFSLVACDGDGSPTSTKPSDSGELSEYYPEEKKDGRNTFSLEKKSVMNDVAIVTLKIGGTEVKLAGFDVKLKFDEKIEVKEVVGKSNFGSVVTNTSSKGEIKLVWASSSNVTEESEICEITLELNGVKSPSIEIEIIDLGCLVETTEDGRAPVRNIDGYTEKFTLK